MHITSQEIAEITLARIKGDFSVSSYSIDSRSLKKGDAFIAIKGENIDGHRFIKEAIKKGATVLFINEDFFKENNNINFPNIVIVKDTLIALEQIARYNRKISKANFIGITGSVGKTTLKEMLSFVLSQRVNTYKSFGNYNNHIGLPFSLAHIEEASKQGIFEMGMSSKGEISYLSNIIKPDIAVITEVSKAHAEFFSSKEQIAYAKIEIMDYMPKNSTIFLNKDSEFYSLMSDRAKEKEINIISFSSKQKRQNNADIYVEELKIDYNFKEHLGIRVVANIFGERITFKLSSILKHHSFMMSLALGIAKVLKFDINEVAKELDRFEVPKGRGNIIRNLEVINKFKQKKEIYLIDDSYNASPSSFKALLSSVKDIKGNKVLVLGDMLELGNISKIEHKNLQEYLKDIDFKKVFLLGDHMKILKDINQEKDNILHFMDYKDLINILVEEVQNEDILIMKGSLGSNIYKVSKYLQKAV